MEARPACVRLATGKKDRPNEALPKERVSVNLLNNTEAKVRPHFQDIECFDLRRSYAAKYSNSPLRYCPYERAFSCYLKCFELRV